MYSNYIKHKHKNEKTIKKIYFATYRALEIGTNANLNAPKNTINNIVITGLGGSGIGGKIATQLVADQLQIPAVINDYRLPSFVNEHTLVIVSSFSQEIGRDFRSFRNSSKSQCRNSLHNIWGKLAEIAKNIIIIY